MQNHEKNISYLNITPKKNATNLKLLEYSALVQIVNIKEKL